MTRCLTIEEEAFISREVLNRGHLRKHTVSNGAGISSVACTHLRRGCTIMSPHLVKCMLHRMNAAQIRVSTLVCECCISPAAIEALSAAVARSPSPLPPPSAGKARSCPAAKAAPWDWWSSTLQDDASVAWTAQIPAAAAAKCACPPHQLSRASPQRRSSCVQSLLADFCSPCENALHPALRGDAATMTLHLRRICPGRLLEPAPKLCWARPARLLRAAWLLSFCCSKSAGTECIPGTGTCLVPSNML